MPRPVTLALAFAFALLCTPSAHGQVMGNSGGGDERYFARIFKDITLSQSQIAQRDSIMVAMRAKQPVFVAGSQLTPAARDSIRQEMTKTSEQRLSALRSILTAEQQKTFDANVKPPEKPGH